MKKEALNKKISGADGPTSVFVIKKNNKLTLKQKIEKMKYSYKRSRVEKSLLVGGHTLDEVMDYIVRVHGFVETDSNSEEVLEEYREMRASFLLRYAPELLGEYSPMPQLDSTEEAEVRKFLEKSRQRVQRAMEKPPPI